MKKSYEYKFEFSRASRATYAPNRRGNIIHTFFWDIITDTGRFGYALFPHAVFHSSLLRNHHFAKDTSGRTPLKVVIEDRADKFIIIMDV